MKGFDLAEAQPPLDSLNLQEEMIHRGLNSWQLRVWAHFCVRITVLQWMVVGYWFLTQQLPASIPVDSLTDQAAITAPGKTPAK